MARRFIRLPPERRHELIGRRYRPANRLGLATQIALMRHPGFGLQPDIGVPDAILHYLAAQIVAEVDAFADYGQRAQTRNDHADIRRFWQQHYDWIKIDKVSFNFDDARREVRFAMEGKGNMGWQTAAGTIRRRYWSHASVMAYRPDFVREAGSDKSAPFAVNFPSYSEDHETVVLPNQGNGFSLAGKDVDQKIAGVAYHRTSLLSNGVVTISVSERSLAPEFSAAEAKRTEVVLRELNDDTVYILAPVTYGRR